MRMLLFTLALALAPSAAPAQTWSELHLVPRETSVRVFQKGGKGLVFADGKLLLVKDDELTILRNRRPLAIPRASISRVETRRRDRPTEGALIGALAGAAAISAGGGQGCPHSQCIFAGMATWSALGALLDWSMTTERTVYRAP